jgi:hypothetical protein
MFDFSCASISDRNQRTYIQALLAKAAVKRFNVRIISRFARSGKVQRDLLVVRPAVERFTDELAFERLANVNGSALATKVID